jgi:hypothetical protein
MRLDLLYSEACINWAVSNIPSFEKRLNTWLEDNVYLVVKELEDNPTDNMLIMLEKEMFPLEFNVEAGAYINAIRSSLDILATSLAERYSMLRPDKAYFPVAANAREFAAGGYKGAEFVKALPDAERAIIESLKPYKGGNDSLWALHKLDIMRKHQRLISADPCIATFRIWGWGVKFVFASGQIRANNETVIGFIPKACPRCNVDFTPHITINEVDFMPRKPIIPALNDFAGFAKSIIELFG